MLHVLTPECSSPEWSAGVVVPCFRSNLFRLVIEVLGLSPPSYLVKREPRRGIPDSLVLVIEWQLVD